MSDYRDVEPIRLKARERLEAFVLRNGLEAAHQKLVTAKHSGIPRSQLEKWCTGTIPKTRFAEIILEVFK